MKRLTIAIDGPAGAGKSTVAKTVASLLNYIYIDTGAMYRAIAWEARKKNLDSRDETALTAVARTIQIELKNGGEGLIIFANGQDVTQPIRSPEVTAFVASVAKVPGVRKALLGLQRQMAVSGGVVMDGRDIGTTVLPRADVKIFLTATVEERASRRHKELLTKGYSVELATLKQEIEERDRLDSERDCAPLIQATDAILVDTSDLTIEQVVQDILTICRRKG
ncbi:cytidylate kinase [Sporomusaceae bacterium BoRhaA]|uniref:(d)CMP kinase n=1 Tax=Pelorhabdus rhamnosifermentans TaxID=2772457 RepID=UPI001C060CC4|nr:(d)CMP kinase [Pelorhabdus rhamnosifermentans]MBU2701024.1 cytidylate kinase [Pelorhabdus rhamnosifermentans]